MKKSTHFWRSALVILAIGVAQVPGEAPADHAFDMPKDRYKAMKKLDANHDNRLSEQEFVGEGSRKNRSKARKQFKRLDKDHDGWLSFKEISEN